MWLCSARLCLKIRSLSRNPWNLFQLHVWQIRIGWTPTQLGETTHGTRQLASASVTCGTVEQWFSWSSENEVPLKAQSLKPLLSLQWMIGRFKTIQGISHETEPNRHPAYAIPTHIQFQVHQQTQIGQCLGTLTRCRDNWLKLYKKFQVN